MFVKYTPKHAHIKVVPIVNNDGLSVTAESIILNPGTNEVSEAKWEKIKSNLSAEIAEGTIATRLDAISKLIPICISSIRLDASSYLSRYSSAL